MDKGIWVTGSGTAMGARDECVITVGSEVRRPSAAGALAASAESLAQMRTVLRGSGLAESALSTSAVSLTPVYDAYPTVAGFQAAVQLTATTGDIDSAGELLTAVVAAGGDAARVHAVTFRHSDASGLMGRARDAAWADALGRASQLAGTGRPRARGRAGDRRDGRVPATAGAHADGGDGGVGHGREDVAGRWRGRGRRQPDRRLVPALTMDRDTYLQQWSTLHGGARPNGIVGGWLRMVHAVAAPLVRLRVPPDAVTLLGLLIASSAPVLASLGRWGVVAAALVIALSGLFDSLDGAVAVMTGRTSRWGAVLDAVTDRISDAVFVATLWVVGAPAPVCVAAVALCWLQEYARARAGGAGMTEVGVLTLNERPTRVIVVVMTLLASAARPDDDPGWATLGAWALVGLGVIGLVQLLVVIRRTLGGGD